MTGSGLASLPLFLTPGGKNGAPIFFCGLVHPLCIALDEEFTSDNEEEVEIYC